MKTKIIFLTLIFWMLSLELMASIGCPPSQSHMDNFCEVLCIEKQHESGNGKKRPHTGVRLSAPLGQENSTEYNCKKEGNDCTGNIKCQCKNADGTIIGEHSVKCCSLDPFDASFMESFSRTGTLENQ